MRRFPVLFTRYKLNQIQPKYYEHPDVFIRHLEWAAYYCIMFEQKWNKLGEAFPIYDNKITAQELHNYVKENVTQQSSGSQTPELQGDKDRVLVQFN